MRINNVMPSGRRDYIIGALFLFDKLRALTDETRFLRDVVFRNEKLNNLHKFVGCPARLEQAFLPVPQ